MRIMLVGGSSPLLEELRQQLVLKGHQVVVIATYNQAMKSLAADATIGAVIMDAISSDESGIKVLNARRADRRLAQVPILFAGTNFEVEAVAQYQELGAFDVILLPVEPATLEAKILRADREGKKTVLIVDDEEAITDILENHLMLERYRTLTASSGKEAIKIMSHQTVHALVTDFMMPGMSGLELLVRVKSDWPQIPVIMITAYSGKFTPKDAIEAGADGYFSKPFHNVELSFMLAKVFAKYKNSAGTLVAVSPTT